jgi:hypothetical protein
MDPIQNSRLLAPKKTHLGSESNTFEQFFRQKIKYFRGNQKIGQRIKSFWADIGQNLFFFQAIIEAVNNTPVSKKFGQRIISF